MGFSSKFVWIAIAIFFVLSLKHCQADELTPDYYSGTCPKVLKTIRQGVRNAIALERRMAATLIRLQFHDCFVQGCDGSVLLADTPEFTGEQNAVQNTHSIRGMEVIDNIKQDVEAVCPGIVSCADIVAVAARDSSKYVNGPTWTVKLGRRDSTTANKDLATADLPFGNDTLDALIDKFARKGFSAQEMVALSGAHTIGQAQCIQFRDRIYNETNIDPDYAVQLRSNCPTDNSGIANLSPLDPVAPDSFDNNYYKNLMKMRGLLHSDQVLYDGAGGETDSIVADYSNNRTYFYEHFAAAMVKLGDMDPLTGSSGEIRKVCSMIN